MRRLCFPWRILAVSRKGKGRNPKKKSQLIIWRPRNYQNALRLMWPRSLSAGRHSSVTRVQPLLFDSTPQSPVAPKIRERKSVNRRKQANRNAGWLGMLRRHPAFYWSVFYVLRIYEPRIFGATGQRSRVCLKLGGGGWQSCHQEPLPSATRRVGGARFRGSISICELPLFTAAPRSANGGQIRREIEKKKEKMEGRWRLKPAMTSENANQRNCRHWKEW